MSCIHHPSSPSQLKVWDPRMFVEKPLNTIVIDQAAGVIMPFYDPDTNILYAAGKGTIHFITRNYTNNLLP